MTILNGAGPARDIGGSRVGTFRTPVPGAENRDRIHRRCSVSRLSIWLGSMGGKRTFALLVILLAGGAYMNAMVNAAELVVNLRFDGLHGSDQGSLELELEVYNPTGEPIRFLPWHTPLEGYRNHFMHVLNRAGQETAYRGEMADRRPPQKSDYRTIAPGERVTARFDLFEAYPVQEPGAYSIQFFGASVNDLRNSNVLFFSLDERGRLVRSPLTVDLHLERTVVPAGAPIWVEFAVQNVGTEAVPFLPWYTPLETIPTRYFGVTGPMGERVQYLSLMIDRSAPQPTDYIRIEPGEQRETRVDLRPLYRFGSGVYTLRYLWIGEDFAAIYPLTVHLE